MNKERRSIPGTLGASCEMRIYPPYKKKIVQIRNPEKFRSYLADVTEVWNTNHHARYVGTVSDKGFLVHIKRHTFDTFRPRIRGVYAKSADNTEFLTIHLEFKKQPMLFLMYFLFFVIIAGLIKGSLYPIIPIVIIGPVFFYLLGWVFYQIDLKKTQIELEYLVSKAST